MNKLSDLNCHWACTLLFVLISGLHSCQTKRAVQPTEWIISDLLQNDGQVDIFGNPLESISPYGPAVAFNGEKDALFLNENPVNEMESFTVEMIFKPSSGAPFEQRVLHIGEVTGDRMLLEIRAREKDWYFDGFVASEGNKLALIDSTRTHPLDQWHHVALVVEPHQLSTYVNGQLELKEPYTFTPIETGKTSIGVRLNRVSWFKGQIHKITIIPAPLAPGDFGIPSKQTFN